MGNDLNRRFLTSVIIDGRIADIMKQVLEGKLVIPAFVLDGETYCRFFGSIKKKQRQERA